MSIVSPHRGLSRRTMKMLLHEVEFPGEGYAVGEDLEVLALTESGLDLL